MITQISAFDRNFLRKGTPLLITQNIRNKEVVFNAIIQSVLPLKMTVVYVEGSGVELKDIRPHEIANGSTKMQLMIPYNPNVHDVVAETATTIEEEEEQEEMEADAH